MSYDIFIFDPAAAPSDRDAFLQWYRRIVQWGDPPETYDPANLNQPLLKFVHQFHGSFPAMNDLGPLPLPASRGSLWSKIGKKILNKTLTLPPPNLDLEDSRFTDYTCARVALYLGFAWSEAENALKHSLIVAEKVGAGVFLTSDKNGAILRTRAELKAALR